MSHKDLTNELSFCRGHFGKVSLKSGSALTPGHMQSSGVPRVLGCVMHVIFTCIQLEGWKCKHQKFDLFT